MTWLYGQTWLWYLLAFLVGVLLAWLFLVLPQTRRRRDDDHGTGRDGREREADAGPGRTDAERTGGDRTADAPSPAAPGDDARRPAVEEAVTERLPAVDPALSTLDTSSRRGGLGTAGLGTAGLGAAGLGAAGLASAGLASAGHAASGGGSEDARRDAETTREIPRVDPDAEATARIPAVPATGGTPEADPRSGEETTRLPAVTDPGATTVFERPTDTDTDTTTMPAVAAGAAGVGTGAVGAAALAGRGNDTATAPSDTDTTAPSDTDTTAPSDTDTTDSTSPASAAGVGVVGVAAAGTTALAGVRTETAPDTATGSHRDPEHPLGADPAGTDVPMASATDGGTTTAAPDRAEAPAADGTDEPARTDTAVDTTEASTPADDTAEPHLGAEHPADAGTTGTGTTDVPTDPSTDASTGADPVGSAPDGPAPAAVAAAVAGVGAGALAGDRGSATAGQHPVVATPTASADGNAHAPFGAGSARPATDGSSPDAAFRIKGNVDTMRYHGPGSPYFERTAAAVWFRTAQDAEAAGFVAWSTQGRAPKGPVAVPESPAAAGSVAPGRFAGSALPLDGGAAPGPEYTVKGNANSMLHHSTASPYYGRTKAEVWFRTAEEAEAAGFADWKRRT